jgi:hypothetical protein
MNRAMIDMCSDYLITAFGQVSATNLARSFRTGIDLKTGKPFREQLRLKQEIY